ncbi:hypothetical protein BS78_01G071700 [Paspalum vaginatum]|nr:hypothetical protein BS78_01G071700 [Paspalum vaginatum]
MKQGRVVTIQLWSRPLPLLSTSQGALLFLFSHISAFNSISRFRACFPYKIKFFHISMSYMCSMDLTHGSIEATGTKSLESCCTGRMHALLFKKGQILQKFLLLLQVTTRAYLLQRGNH